MVRSITLYTYFKSNICLLSWSSWHLKCLALPGEWMHPSPLLTALWLPWASASALLPCSLFMVIGYFITKTFSAFTWSKSCLCTDLLHAQEEDYRFVSKTWRARSLSRFSFLFRHIRNIFTLQLWWVLWNDIWRANCSISSAAAKTSCRDAAISEPEGPEKAGCITST